jgi:hypothetical protein
MRRDPERGEIHDRTELIDHLSVACELEQGLCLQYLFTAFSLKDSPEEGLRGETLTQVRKWKGAIFLIAAQEMLHLAQAANLLSAIGGTVQLRRPNFPQSPRYYPTGLPWGLLPFSRDTIRLYACYERPEHLTPELRKLLGNLHFDMPALFREKPGEFDAKRPRRHLPARYEAQRPRSSQYETIGELYAAIRRAFIELDTDKRPLFIGPYDAQVDGDMIDFPQIIKVVDRATAVAAIDLIVQQGEGCPSDRQDSHFGLFVNILREYDALSATLPDFKPARDVHPNPLSRLHVDNTYPGWRLIDDPFTRAVNDLTSDVYQAMMVALYRFFATSEDSLAQRGELARTSLYTMTTVLKPLGEALTKLPMGDRPSAGGTRPGFAGASFEIDRAIQLLPHQQPTWLYLGERLLELAGRAKRLSLQARASVAEGNTAYASAIPELQSATVTLERIADEFSRKAEAHLRRR